MKDWSSILLIESSKGKSAAQLHRQQLPQQRGKLGDQPLQRSCVSIATSVRIHMQARSVVCVFQMIPNTREGRLCTGRSINRPDVFASLFQTGCARECYSNCHSKATEIFSNGSNINGKFTAIKDTLTTREALSSQDNTQYCCSPSAFGKFSWDECSQMVLTR